MLAMAVHNTYDRGMKRVLIVGCGYVGFPLGAQLALQGNEVFGVRRTIADVGKFREVGIQPIIADITNPEDLARLPGPFDWVINLVSSSHGGVEEYRQAYLQGTRNLVDWLQASPPKKFLYTSSTGVYGQTDGSQVKEGSPTQPLTETGQVLLATEQVLLNAFRQHQFPAVILRVAGIYGPGRGHLFKLFLKNEARIEGKGDRFLNMIHLDDLVQVIIAALNRGQPGEVYNAVDDEPVTELHFFHWLAETFCRPLPPHGPPPEPEERKRGRFNRRIMNRKLKMELGYEFQHATFRQGYNEEIHRLDEAGELDQYQPLG